MQKLQDKQQQQENRHSMENSLDNYQGYSPIVHSFSNMNNQQNSNIQEEESDHEVNKQTTFNFNNDNSLC